MGKKRHFFSPCDDTKKNAPRAYVQRCTMVLRFLQNFLSSLKNSAFATARGFRCRIRAVSQHRESSDGRGDGMISGVIKCVSIYTVRHASCVRDAGPEAEGKARGRRLGQIRSADADTATVGVIEWARVNKFPSSSSRISRPRRFRHARRSFYSRCIPRSPARSAYETVSKTRLFAVSKKKKTFRVA